MTELTDTTDIRDTVREKYAAAARAASRGAYDQARALESGSGCWGSEGGSCSPADTTGVFGATMDDEAIVTMSPRPRSARRWAPVYPPRSPTSTRARRFSTSARAAGPTC